MGLVIRVIATLLVDPARGVIKGRQFQHDRVIGEPIQWARVMAQLREVDELVVFDVTHDRPDLALIERIVSECFVPLAYGGGVHDIETAARIVSLGVDKIVTNDFDVLTAVAGRFGSQSAVGVVNDDHAALFVQKLVDAGAGEIVVQDYDRDGMMGGYHLQRIAYVRSLVNVPLVASSGAGSPADCVAAVRVGADAVAAGALYAFTDVTPKDVKCALYAAGYLVRLDVAA